MSRRVGSARAWNSASARSVSSIPITIRLHVSARRPRPIMRSVNCCDPRGCDDFFGGRFARRVAARYRKRGLDKTASRIVAFLEGQGVTDATVLEIGGGVGEIQLELLK